MSSQTSSVPDKSEQSFPRFLMFGTWVHALTMADLLALLNEGVGQNKKFVVANHNMHSLYLYDQDPWMQRFCNEATCTVVDGMVVVGLARLLGYPLRREHRLACLDWLDPVLKEACAKGWRIMHVGNAPGVAERAAVILRERYPGLQLRTQDGFFSIARGSAGSEERIAAVDAYQPHLLLVGMGMPRQERWVGENLDRLHANVILNVGALLDYIAGEQVQAPRWMGQLGLEWLFRLSTNPARLWRRYLLEPLTLARKLPRELIVARFRRRPQAQLDT